MKNRDIYWRRYKIQDNKKHCTQDNETSVPFKEGTLGFHTVLPISISCPIVFSWISLMVWKLFPFNGDFSLGNARSLRLSNLVCKGAESPGWQIRLLQTPLLYQIFYSPFTYKGYFSLKIIRYHSFYYRFKTCWKIHLSLEN